MKSPSCEGLLPTVQHFNTICGNLFNRLRLPNILDISAIHQLDGYWQHAVHCMHYMSKRELQRHRDGLTAKYGKGNIPKKELDLFAASWNAQKESFYRWRTELKRRLI